MRLDQSSAIVTGGASGLGRATAELLAGRGTHVVIADLAGSDAPVAARAVGARFVPCDVTDQASLASAFDAAAEGPPLRAVVHCAGRGGDRRRLLAPGGEPTGVESLLEILRVNVGGTYNVLALAAARMVGNEPVDGERGACVLTASVAAFEGQIGQTAYAAAKGAVHAMTIVCARDLASRGIRVNTIAPGVFDTAMVGRLRPDVQADLEAAIPSPGRLGRPGEYAALAAHLLENTYLNGETVRLDGAVRLGPR